MGRASKRKAERAKKPKNFLIIDDPLKPKDLDSRSKSGETPEEKEQRFRSKVVLPNHIRRGLLK